MTREPFTRLQFVRFMLCWPLYVCLFLLVCEALLSAATTWLVIKVGRDVANGNFFVIDLFWILLGFALMAIGKRAPAASGQASGG